MGEWKRSGGGGEGRGLRGDKFPDFPLHAVAVVLHYFL